MTQVSDFEKANQVIAEMRKRMAPYPAIAIGEQTVDGILVIAFTFPVGMTYSAKHEFSQADLLEPGFFSETFPTTLTRLSRAALDKWMRSKIAAAKG